MKIMGIKLTTYLRHPLIVWRAYQFSKLPCIDLDHPDNNCHICGYMHHTLKEIENYKRRG